MKEEFSKYSDAEAYRIARLIAGFLRGTLTTTEHEELDGWVAASNENQELFEKLTDEKNMDEAMKFMESVETEKALQTKKEQLAFSRPRKSFRYWQYAVAASIVVTAGIVIYVYGFPKNEKKNTVTATISHDIQPGSDKATLTLNDGRVIVLDNQGSDTSINGRLKILAKEGEIVYSSEENGTEPEYHTLSIPRKGQYKLILPDGTKVWLNSESSIQYPTAFTGTERRVSVTGETFFEVAKNKEKPFVVIAGDLRVEALGTEFNVNVYSNEPVASTTLVEGSVLVSSGKHENILKPAQQAQISSGDFRVVEADTAEVTAWKNNLFQFSNTPIDLIMRQIERWYDAETVYQNSVSFHFNGTIERTVPLSKLLHYLEETGQAHFNIEGKKIFVMK